MKDRLREEYFNLLPKSAGFLNIRWGSSHIQPKASVKASEQQKLGSILNLILRSVVEVGADTSYEAADSHATVARDPLARGARAEFLRRTRLLVSASFTSAPLSRRLAVPHEAADQQ